MRILSIANPVAGGGRARSGAEALAALLEARGHQVERFYTRGAGDARRRAAELEDAVDRIVAVGGDGTLNEIVNGLADPSRTPLTQMPFGTANILAREMGIPFSAEAVADVVERGATRRLDLGTIGQQRFLLLVSSGFDAEVTRVIRATRKGTLGFLGYVVPILRAAARYRPPRLRVRLDGGEPLPAALVLASNVRNYGGLFTIADRARCDSGQLDVCLFERATRLDIARIGIAGRSGRVSQLPGVAYRTARRVEIEADEPVPVQVDGDYWGETPVALELEPGVVPILVPPGAGADAAPGRGGARS